MSNWYADYLNSATGRRLADIIDTPENGAAFRTLSREGKPAVQAVAQDVAPVIEALATKRERDMACKFVGWFVAQLMRDSGYEIIRERGRVANAPYQTGAVWQLGLREPRFVSEVPPAAGPGRLTFNVQGQAGDAMASWEVTTSETSNITGRPRRVHKVLSALKPLSAAIDEVVGYARRHGFASIWVVDPNKLFPKANWPTV